MTETSCHNDIEFQAPGFELEARYASYQGALVRDVRDITAFWQESYGQIADGAEFQGVCRVIEYSVSEVPYQEECRIIPDIAAGNAFYCPQINTVLWDGPCFCQPRPKCSAERRLRIQQVLNYKLTVMPVPTWATYVNEKRSAKMVKNLKSLDCRFANHFQGDYS